MDASKIINDEMTLDEKLSAIQKALENAQVEHKNKNPLSAPLDPAELTLCEGCQ